MIVYLLLFVVLLCIIHVILNYNQRARLVKRIPGPRVDFIVGNGLTVIRSSVELMKMAREFAKTWDGIYRIWAFPIAAVVIYNPHDVEKILSSMKYNDKSPVYRILKPWLGDGLLVSKGAKWQQRRKILTPTFHFNILRQFCDVFEENSRRLVQTLGQTAGTPVDVTSLISEFTLSSICETAMGTPLNAHTTDAGKSYKETLYQLGCQFYHRLIKIYFYSDFIFDLTVLGREQKKHLKTVHDFTEGVIRQRKEHHKNNIVDISNQDEDDEINVYRRKKKSAMLDLLLIAQKEGLIDKDGVQEEVDTFMFEGHDTTASGLIYCFMLLANHRVIQEKIVTELKDIFGDSTRPIRMDDLAKMKFVECCIKESMRLYPPVHFIGRNLDETTVLSNYTVPAGTHCYILIYDLHRRADSFNNPDQFDPDRFLPENCVGRHPYSYIPFSAGPRNCIGQKFAMMEMKLVVANVLREYALEPVTKPEDIQFLADLVLRNNGPVCVKFVKRQ